MAVPRDRFLTPDRVREVFGRALRRPPEARAAFLDEACEGDADLRAEVESLLEAQEAMGDFLAEPATRLVEDPPLAAGTEIAGFEVERVLGSGSGGTVYEAWQKQPRRRVALKVMRAGIASDAARRRFEAEAEILATLSHPAVAHVYEAGVHDGRPWFALEYVEQARTILAHSRSLGLRARLALVASICDAVHHGHQQGVIHRDLKPGNVLADAAGRLKVIDFGVARVAGREPGPALAGTLPYAAPEQTAPGGRVDVRSDVYSLGVLLYELVADRPPYDVAALTAADAIAAIRAQEPRPLGVRDADVAAIVGKAMAKDPDARYASAAALGQDLRDYLGHWPVTARQGGVLYQLGKFARRHRIASLLVVVLFAVTAAAAVFNRRLAVENARERAEAEFQAYVANIAAASAALRVDDVAEARQRLDAAAPALRNWEWRHLHERLDQSHRTFAWPGVTLLAGASSPDGGLVAAAGQQPAGPPRAKIRVWDHAGAVLYTLDVPVRADALAFDPAGDHLVIGYENGALEQRVARTGTLVWRNHEHAATVIALAFDPRGSRLASASRDATIRLWDPATGETSRILRGHRDRVICAVFGSSGERLYTGARDGEIRVWDVATGAVLATLSGHAASVEGVAVDPHGTRLASGSRDLTVRIWDLASGAEIVSHRSHDANVRAVVFACGMFVSGSWDSTLRRWDPATGRALGRLRGHSGQVLGIATAGDGIVSFGREGTVRFWDPRQPADVIEDHTDLVEGVAFSPDGTRLASASLDGTIRLWDARTLAPVGRHDADGRVLGVAYDGGGRLLAIIEHSSTLVWAEDGTRLATLPGSWAIASGGDRTALTRAGYVATWTGTAWDAPERIPIGGTVVAVAVAPDGRTVAAGNGAGTVLRWSGAGRVEAHVHDGGVRAVAVRGGLIASGGSEGLVVLLDRTTLAVVGTLSGHTEGVSAVAFFPDGTRLASAGDDGTVRLWDVATRRQVAVLHGHRFPVCDVAISPDGATVASSDGSLEDSLSAVRVWSAR